MKMTSDSDIIYIVHGSNAHTWWRRLANGGYPWWRRWSLFCSELRRAFGKDCEIREFHWSGNNTHQARITAGTALARTIEAENPARKIHIVGHSHGGNVALAAVNHLQRGRVETLILLANPHMALVDKHGEPPQWLYWGKAVESVPRIWNIYSLEDKVQCSLARVFHGIPAARHQTLIVRPTYGGTDYKPVLNGVIHWNTSVGAHRALHSGAIGAVAGRLLQGCTFDEAMADSGLSIGGNNVALDRGGFPGIQKTQEMICALADPAPFDLGDRKSGVGILLIHGFTASPAETRPLAEYVTQHTSWRCVGIALPGHGTKIDEMQKSHGGDWINAVEKAYEDLARDCRHVFLAGVSLGAALCCHVALRHRKDAKLRGLILMAPAFGVSLKRAVGLRVLRPFRKMRSKGTRASDYFLDNRLYSYVQNPLNRAADVLRLGGEAARRLGELQGLPVLMFVGDLESTVSLEKLHAAAKRNPWMKFVRLPKSRHILTVEPDREMMFEESVRFVEECLRG
jgi:carboxylesterase